MRRVVPSQIRGYVQTVFENEIEPAWNLPKEHSAKLAGLLMICEGLPEELLTLTGPDYAKYVAALGTIQHQLIAWNYKADPPTLPHVFGKNPLSVIYNLLEQYADEFPSPSTSALAFVADLELRDSIRLDISAANRDLAKVMNTKARRSSLDQQQRLCCCGL